MNGGGQRRMKCGRVAPQPVRFPGEAAHAASGLTRRNWCVGFVVALTSVTACAAPLSLDSSVFSGGGGRSGSARFSVTGSIGQPVAVQESGPAGNFEGRAGFWSQVQRWLNAPPVPAADSVSRRPGEGAHFLLSHLLGNDADADFDPLSFAGFEPLSANGGSVLREGPWLIYQPPAGGDPHAGDTVTYYVTDGLAGPVAGLVQIVQFVPTDAGPPNALAIAADPGPPAAVRVRFQGIAGRSYRVQVAAGVNGPWNDLGTVAAGPDGRAEFTDTMTAGTSFYRLVEP